MRIGFYGKYGRPVTGRTLEESGCGGSESALIYMARELHQLGNEVFVFNRCGNARGNYDGVEYLDISEFPPFLEAGKTLDILVIFRDLDVLKVLQPDTSAIGIKRKVYWAHDDTSFLWNNPKVMQEVGNWLNERTDRIFAVSNWQAGIYTEKFGVKKEKIFVTRNGINLDLFKGDVKREPGRLIYTSVPDRGLDILVDIFPEIKKRTGAELYVFSSFKVYGTPETDEKLKDIFDQAKSEGVHVMEPMPQKDLAKELLRSKLMVYPNHPATFHPVFAETACIAVLEAQAAGTPVITSDRGALPESVLDGETGILIDGDPYSAEYKTRFIEAAADLLKNEEEWARLSRSGRERIRKEYPWAKIAGEWLEEFNRILR